MLLIRLLNDMISFLPSDHLVMEYRCSLVPTYVPRHCDLQPEEPKRQC